jgi:hypothetical protein
MSVARGGDEELHDVAKTKSNEAGQLLVMAELSPGS